MGRPFKRRRICKMPECRRFHSQKASDGAPPIVMTLDEYECIRLMDYEGMTQAECAVQMNVARTTVQSIYETARKKIAGFLVEGVPLVISGGCYGFCDAEAGSCGCPCPRGQKEPKFWREKGKPLHGKAKSMHQAFRERAGSTICREIKGIDTGNVLCSCEDCVRHAVEIAEEI